MKTIGQYLREARKDKGLTLQELSEKTKIKKEFLSAIERERWRALPEFPVVTGFVKNMAGVLDLERDQVVSVLRRDYPPKSLPVNPKPEIRREFRWSPKLTFLLGVGVVIIAIVAYLVAQYVSFVRPPNLVVDSPTENQVVIKVDVPVSGSTDPDTTVIVNNQPALVRDDGSFSTTIEVTNSTDRVEVTAISRAGKKTVVTRKIKPDINN